LSICPSEKKKSGVPVPVLKGRREVQQLLS